MIVDATRYDAKSFPAVCLPARAAMEKVDREWERYGIPGGRSEARREA